MPYDTLSGQLWLALVGGVVAASLTLLTRLDRVDVPTTRLALGDGADEAVGRRAADDGGERAP